MFPAKMESVFPVKYVEQCAVSPGKRPLCSCRMSELTVALFILFKFTDFFDLSPDASFQA